MKRAGGLFEKIYTWENLLSAYGRVRKGKTGNPKMREFSWRLDENLEKIQRDIERCEFDLGHYHSFKIYDPKERMIRAAPIRERIMHHAFVGVLGEYLEKPLIEDTYACRRGFGQWKAVYRAKSFASSYQWCLKLDIRHYFDTIDHEILLGILRKLFKEKNVLAFFENLIISYESEPGKGLPIGNLTSQYLANLYLNCFDRYCQGKGRGYLRYMDDMLVFGGYEDLKKLKKEAPVFLAEKLHLEIKNVGSLHRVREGADFLGCRIFPGKVELNRRSKKRFIRKMRRYDSLALGGLISEGKLQERMTALFSFVERADTAALRKSALDKESEKISELEYKKRSKDIYRVLRGGSWNNNANNCRSANRNNNNPDNGNNNNGFRVALAQDPKNTENSIKVKQNLT